MFILNLEVICVAMYTACNYISMCMLLKETASVVIAATVNYIVIILYLLSKIVAVKRCESARKMQLLLILTLSHSVLTRCGSGP